MPQANEQVARTSKIQIWIAAPNDAPQGSLPGESDGDVTNPAHSFLLDYRVKGVKSRVTVKIDFEDDDGPRMIKENDYDPGDLISIKLVGHGKGAKFVIYFDGELKDTIEAKPGAKTKN